MENHWEYLIHNSMFEELLQEVQELERKLKLKDEAILAWEQECQNLGWQNEEIPLLKGLLNKRIEDLQSNTIETLQFDLKIANDAIEQLDEEISILKSQNVFLININAILEDLLLTNCDLESRM